MRAALLALFLLFSQSFTVFGQQVADEKDEKLNKILLYGGIGYGTTMLALSQAWYKEQGLEKFKFFNDNDEWLQVDKVGHTYSTYNLSRINYELLKKTKLSDRKAVFWSSAVSSLLLLPVEILDGFSPDFGFSYGDIIANTAGSGLFLGQQLLWNEQRIKLKWSFHQTSLAPLRPNLLGDGLAEELLKDYNGQTYWLSVDVHAFAKESKFPKWLNLAFGYGGQDMVRARDSQNLAAGFNNFRQYYFGIDFDLSYIQTDKKWLKVLLFIGDMIRLPAPAIELSQGKFKGHLLYY
ncbi:DUF2279 domain-containing protein [Roseivirga misakiensis]|uniref:DUF2279 domain-containing protein n=1 Tax=Roseivirga misakiensis TaxID=1563681 RepID=A0A1E5T1Z3_9BACT|nr:DUF2279 domain-containing protein [Roseivirga misakiensis]OEK05317.1 hypothetical protein BFP71_18145 [Roseivirga misakiensis]